MRRLMLLLLGLAIAGVALYRHREIDRLEQELAIGRHAGGR
jgi:hypothetical protein